jgi:hypothetical protein
MLRSWERHAKEQKKIDYEYTIANFAMKYIGVYIVITEYIILIIMFGPI